MLTAFTQMGVEWSTLHNALLQSPIFEIAVANASTSEANQISTINIDGNDIYAFNNDGSDDSDSLDEDDDFDDSGVEVIYVRD
jgi:hypothetical protein